MNRYNTISATSADFVKTYFRKHECPICGKELQVIKVTKFVFENSSEAKNWSFTVNGKRYIGDALFVLIEFFCSHCTFQTDIDDFLTLQVDHIPNDPIYYEMHKQKAAVRYINNADVEYIYVTTKKKKRYCPECEKPMISTYDYKTIDSNAPEAKDYDFTIGGKQIEGRVEFRDGYFWCPNKKCDKKISFTDMKKLETGSY